MSQVAVYWARWGVWTLVSPEQFVDKDGNVKLDMLKAIDLPPSLGPATS